MLDREGNFKARIEEMGLSEKDSGAVQLGVKYAITDILEQGEWQDWQGYGQTCLGYHNLVKKDGTLNDMQIKALRDAIGWTGDFSELNDGRFNAVAVQITVKPNTYQGKTEFRADWINHIDYEGGVLSNVDDSKLKALNARFGGQLRALGTPAPKPPPAKNTAPVARKPTQAPAAVSAQSDGFNYDDYAREPEQ